jgi:hypothetical protein
MQREVNGEYVYYTSQDTTIKPDISYARAGVAPPACSGTNNEHQHLRPRTIKVVAGVNLHCICGMGCANIRFINTPTPIPFVSACNLREKSGMGS